MGGVVAFGEVNAGEEGVKSGDILVIAAPARMFEPIIAEGTGGGEIGKVEVVAGVLGPADRDEGASFQLRGSCEIRPCGRDITERVGRERTERERNSHVVRVLSGLGQRRVGEHAGFEQTPPFQRHPACVPEPH